jgi:hypothetical protein
MASLSVADLSRLPKRIGDSSGRVRLGSDSR